MKKKIRLSTAELQSGLDRVKAAEGLILQLPKNHDGRNTWLLNYGVSREARSIRQIHAAQSHIEWDEKTQSLNYMGIR